MISIPTELSRKALGPSEIPSPGVMIYLEAGAGLSGTKASEGAEDEVLSNAAEVLDGNSVIVPDAVGKVTDVGEGLLNINMVFQCGNRPPCLSASHLTPITISCLPFPCPIVNNYLQTP